MGWTLGDDPGRLDGTGGRPRRAGDGLGAGTPRPDQFLVETGTGDWTTDRAGQTREPLAVPA